MLKWGKNCVIITTETPKQTRTGQQVVLDESSNQGAPELKLQQFLPVPERSRTTILLSPTLQVIEHLCREVQGLLVKLDLGLRSQEKGGCSRSKGAADYAEFLLLFH